MEVLLLLCPGAALMLKKKKKNPCGSLAKMFEETQTPDQLTEEEVEMSAFQEAITQLMLLSSNNYHSNSHL